MARKDLESVFQQVYGRSPSAQEEAFFGKFIDDGHLQPYEVSQYLQALPEATQARLPEQSQQYGQALAGQDEAILNRAGDQLQSQFYQQGRPRSSGYTAAYLNAARDLAISRQPQIADFYRQGLQGVSQGFQQFGGGAVGRGFGLRDQQRQRQWDIEDYYRKQNDFNTYLNAQNRLNRQAAFGQMAGMAVGAGIGGAFGGLGGARLGGGLGGAFGQSLGGF